MSSGARPAQRGIHLLKGVRAGPKGLPDYLGAKWRPHADIPILCVSGCPARRPGAVLPTNGGRIRSDDSVARRLRPVSILAPHADARSAGRIFALRRSDGCYEESRRPRNDRSECLLARSTPRRRQNCSDHSQACRHHRSCCAIGKQRLKRNTLGFADKPSSGPGTAGHRSEVSGASRTNPCSYLHGLPGRRRQRGLC